MYKAFEPTRNRTHYAQHGLKTYAIWSQHILSHTYKLSSCTQAFQFFRSNTTDTTRRPFCIQVSRGPKTTSAAGRWLLLIFKLMMTRSTRLLFTHRLGLIPTGKHEPTNRRRHHVLCILSLFICLWVTVCSPAVSFSWQLLGPVKRWTDWMPLQRGSGVV